MNFSAFNYSTIADQLAPLGINQLNLIAPLCMGTSNQNFLVRSEADTWVLRINNPLTNKLCPRANEVACWRSAEAAGLAPELKFVSDDFQYYLSRYVDTGDTWQKHYRSYANATGLLSELLDNVAKLPMPEHTLTPSTQWRFYEQEITSRLAQLNPVLKIAAADILALGTQALAVLTRLEQNKSMRFCHRDLNPHNLLLEKNRLLCIDFEYACTSDSRLELAALLAHHQLNHKQKNHLIDSQLSGSRQEKIEALNDANLIYWLFTACWALLMCDDGKGAQSWYDDALRKIRQQDHLLTQ